MTLRDIQTALEARGVAMSIHDIATAIADIQTATRK